MAQNDKIRVEVTYALPDEQVLLEVMADPGTNLAEAIRLSGILERYPDIALETLNKVGIFGKLAKMDKVLQSGDRVEIYRPLIADPKEVRRKRAEEGKVMTKGAAAVNVETDDAADKTD